MVGQLNSRMVNSRMVGQLNNKNIDDLGSLLYVGTLTSNTSLLIHMQEESMVNDACTNHMCNSYP